MDRARDSSERVESDTTVPTEHRFAPEEWDDQPLCTRIVYALATVEEKPPEQVDVRLADHVDPDALDRLFSNTDDASSTSRVLIQLPDHTVQALASGELVVHRDGRPENTVGRS